jgi:hypothetical protein
MHHTKQDDGMMPLDVDFNRIWHGISGRMWETHPGGVERLATRLLRSPALGRALVKTPSLFVAWLMASVFIFAIGAVLTNASNQPLVPLLAPAVAGIGVAFAYGAGADPAWEISRSTAMPQRLLLLLRVVVVFATNTLIGMIATLLTGRVSELTVLWLLPMAAVALLGLAVAVTTDSPTVGSAAALVVWCGAMAMTWIDTRQAVDAISASRIQEGAPLWCGLLAMSAVTIWFAESDRFGRGESGGDAERCEGVRDA